MAELTGIFPDLTPKQILSGPVAREVFGPIPDYSHREEYQIANVTTATVGAFLIIYGKYPETGETCLVITEGGNRGVNMPKFAATGGFICLDKTEKVRREQPVEGALREASEEICDDNGKPIITIDPAQCNVIVSGVDYRQADKGWQTQYTGFAYGASDEQMRQLHQHCQRLQADPAYQESCLRASGGETKNVFLIPLTDKARLFALPFAHPHELNAIKDVIWDLQERPGALQPRQRPAEFAAA